MSSPPSLSLSEAGSEIDKRSWQCNYSLHSLVCKRQLKPLFCPHLVWLLCRRLSLFCPDLSPDMTSSLGRCLAVWQHVKLNTRNHTVIYKKSHYSSLSGPFPAPSPPNSLSPILHFLHRSCYANAHCCRLNFFPYLQSKWSGIDLEKWCNGAHSSLSSSHFLFISAFSGSSLFFCRRPCHCSLSLPFICSFKHRHSSIRPLKLLSIIMINSIHHSTNHLLSSTSLHKSFFHFIELFSLTSRLPSFYLLMKGLISVNYLLPFVLSQCFDMGNDLETVHRAWS